MIAWNGAGADNGGDTEVKGADNGGDTEVKIMGNSSIAFRQPPDPGIISNEEMSLKCHKTGRIPTGDPTGDDFGAWSGTLGADTASTSEDIIHTVNASVKDGVSSEEGIDSEEKAIRVHVEVEQVASHLSHDTAAAAAADASESGMKASSRSKSDQGLLGLSPRDLMEVYTSLP